MYRGVAAHCCKAPWFVSDFKGMKRNMKHLKNEQKENININING